MIVEIHSFKTGMTITHTNVVSVDIRSGDNCLVLNLDVGFVLVNLDEHKQQVTIKK